MNVLVCLISSQDNITEIIARQGERLIPQDLFKKKGPGYPVNFKVSIYNPRKESISFEKFLLREAKTSEAVILLTENSHSNLVEPVENAVFAATFEVGNERIGNFKNFFGSYFSQLFRNFFVVKTLMGDAEKAQAMMLPLRNFNAPELREMARLSREESRNTNFILPMEALLAKIVKRRVPRKNSSYPQKKYFVDERKMHFIYGTENHAQFDTGKPHIAACEFNGHFRFGKRIDPNHHYNVSFGDGDKTNIAGDFPDCHGAVQQVTKRSHLNMFSNDFF
jgi:hypothetical protein